MKKMVVLLLISTTIFLGCKKEKTAIAGFTLEKTSFYLGEPLKLTNTSTNSLEYNWDFGNGKASTSATPEMSYITAEIYEIKLLSGKSTLIKKVKINNGTASYQVYNNTAVDLLMSSYYYNGEVLDLINKGNIIKGQSSDTVYTSRDKISLGGVLLGKTFIVVDDYLLTKFSYKRLEINGQTRIFSNAKPSDRNVLL